MMRLLPALILGLALVARQSEPVTAGVATAATVIAKLIGVAMFIKNIAEPNHAADLLHRFDAVTDRIRSLENMVQSVSSGLPRDIARTTGGQVSWHLTAETLENLLRQINSKYDRFLLYQRDRDSIERATLEDFADEAVSHDSDSLHSTMYSLRDLALGGSPGSSRRRKRYDFKEGLFRSLKSVLQTVNSTRCGLQHSPQQMAFSLYGTVAKALTKNFAMVQFSYKLLRLLNKGSFAAEEKHFFESFKDASRAVASEANTVIQGMSSKFWRCDPARHVRGVTYEEVTHLMQGYISGEVDLNYRGSCTSKCSWFKNVTNTDSCYGEGGSWDPLCQNQRRCDGTLYDCEDIGTEATICLAEPGSPRLYHWVEYGDGQALSRSNDRSEGECAKTQKVERWTSGFAHCSYCFCYCDDRTDSSRYFSLEPAGSDVYRNMVVTGVRIKRMSKVFHIQLQQGVADRAGTVIPCTVHWKPVNVNFNTSSPARLRRNSNTFELSYKKRDVVLGELNAPSGHVVTGVSFSEWGEDDDLSIKMQVTPISDEGVLRPNASRWVNLQGTIQYLNIGSDLTPSTILGTQSWPHAVQQYWLKFVPSSVAADAAQTTLPLLDVQEVAPVPATRLTGIGLYHKGQRGGGGFIGLSVTSADRADRRQQAATDDN